MMESVYCDFSKLPTDPGNWFQLILIDSLFKYKFYYLKISLKRFSEMDRVRRRQIDARPFLRPAQF
jgi:hypothetical protein